MEIQQKKQKTFHKEARFTKEPAIFFLICKTGLGREML